MIIKDFSSSNKRAALKNLLNSSDFSSSEKYQNLLNYIYDCSLNKTPIKEATIAIDCLGKDSSFDPSIDSSVRVYLSKLRKKIEHYYLTEGINDEIELYIPKGQYHLEFRELNRKNNIHNSNWKIYSILGLIIILFSAVSYFIGSKTNYPKNTSIPEYDIIWNDIFNSPKKTLIILGDYYLFAYPFSENRQSYIRDVEINSETDLEIFTNSEPKLKDKIEPIYHTYLDEHIPICLSLILPSFINNNVEYDLKLASEVQLDDLNKYNVVYIGSYKTLAILKNIIGKLNFKYTIERGANTLEFLDQDKNETSTHLWTTDNETKARNDYAMVIKLKGPNDNSFIFFLSQHDFGNISTVKYFTNISKIKNFERKLNSSYFEALFEVKGIIRTDFDIKLLNINQLKSDFLIDLSTSPIN